MAHRPNTGQNFFSGSGFSGSVFERVNPLPGENRFVIALRGTEFPSDLWRDVLSADFGDLIANGLAWKQIIDLHHWWSLRQAFVSGGERAISALRAHHQALPPLLRVTLLWPRLGSRRAALCQLRVELNVAGLTKRGFCFAPEKCD